MTKAVDKKLLWNWLTQVKKMLDELHIPFFLSVGTCLWIIRDGDFLNDDDIDLGIMEEYEYRFNDIVKAAETRGWTTETFTDCISGKGKMITIFKAGCKTREETVAHGYVDIGFYYRKENKVWKSINNGYCIPEVYDARFFNEFKIITVHKMDFLVPNPVEEYLTELFGDWKTERIGIAGYKHEWQDSTSTFFRKCVIHDREEARKFLESCK